MAKHRNIDEIRAMAKEIMESLRPKHLTVCQIKQVAQELALMTENIVLREAPDEKLKPYMTMVMYGSGVRNNLQKHPACSWHIA